MVTETAYANWSAQTLVRPHRVALHGSEANGVNARSECSASRILYIIP
jgi:hypothetical protein